VIGMKDLVKTIAEQADLSQAQTRDLLQKFLEGITETLVREGEIRLGGFGTFEVKTRKGRTGRNPRTGEKLNIPARAVLTFRPGLEVREKIAKRAEPSPPQEAPPPQAQETQPPQPQEAKPPQPTGESATPQG
jgi:nucleoid DNA-binding protein